MQALCERLPDVGGADARTIPLAPLTPEESTQLARNLLEIENLPAETRQLILDKVEGNPFFLEEVLRSLLDAGLIVFHEGGIMTTQPIEEIDVPDTLHAVIAARVDRLAPEAKYTLQTASVVGRVFQQRVLAKMLQDEIKSDRIDTSLDQLHRREFIRLRKLELTGPEYIFKHVLTQDVTYNSLLIAQRKTLHRVAGEAIEALFPDRLDELAATLAYHFERAEVNEKAMHYLTRAGDRAKATYANREAMASYRAAIGRTDQMLARAETPLDPKYQIAAGLHERLGDVFELTGQHDEAQRAYQGALPHIPAHDPVWQARIQRKIGKALHTQYRYEESFQAFDRAEAALGPEPADSALAWWQEWVEIQCDRVWHHYWLAQVDEIVELIEKTRPLVEQYGMPLQCSRFFQTLVLMALRRDRYVISEETLADAWAAVEAGKASGDLNETATQEFMMGFCLLWHGNLDEAKEHLQTALALTERTGDVATQTRCLTYLTVVCRKRGQAAQSLQYASQALAVATPAQMPEYIGAAKANMSWAACREAILTLGETYARDARKLWEQSQTVYPFQWLALFPLAFVALEQDSPAEAIDCIRTVLSPDQQRLPDDLTAAAEAAVAAWDQNEPDVAQDRARAVLELAQQSGLL
jgi:tetratricopeptide (TPR) repeat protein